MSNALKKSWIPIAILSLIASNSVYGDWVDDIVDDTQAQINQFDVSIDEDLQTSKLLPLDESNTWAYDSGGVAQSASLGDTEDLGDLCIRPLVFNPLGTKLYLANHNDRVVFYGFQTVINEQAVEFFPRNGELSSVDSGINLAGLADAELFNDQQGEQLRFVGEEEILVTWFVVNKRDTGLLSSNDTLNVTGRVAGEDRNADLSNKVEFHFELRLSPGECASEISCFAGRFEFQFIPGVGLSYFSFSGDSLALGGQFSQSYTLDESATLAFDLTSDENQLSFYSCEALPIDQTVNSNNIQRSDIGTFKNWFNILLLFAVLLNKMPIINRPNVSLI